MNRNRATGWQHAKISGHTNETLVESLFEDSDFRKAFANRIGVKNIKSAKVGGLHETNVRSVFGDTTKSKTDLQLEIDNGDIINISIKKSCNGQVYLIGVDRFIEGFELQFNEIIPQNIKNLLHLYFYGHPETDSLLNKSTITNGQSSKLVQYQIRHNRLVWKSLCNMDIKAAHSLIDWFKLNIGKIAELCFSRGLAANSDDWAHYVWYINELGEDDTDIIVSIKEIKKAVTNNTNLTYASKINGGSTIQLPFGFVQWHQTKMQFHHNREKLTEIVAEQL